MRRDFESGGLELQFHGADSPGTLLYLPGLHGDSSFIGPFRRALAGRVQLGETSYPRRPDWSLTDYAGAVEKILASQNITRVWLLAESFSLRVRGESHKGGAFLIGNDVDHLLGEPSLPGSVQ